MYGLDWLFAFDEEAMECLGFPMPRVDARGLVLLYDPGETISEHRVLIDIGKEGAKSLGGVNDAWRLWVREYITARQLIRQGVEPGNIIAVMPDSWDPGLQARLSTVLYPRVIANNDLGIKLMLVSHHIGLLSRQYMGLLGMSDSIVVGITMHRLPLMGKTIECFREASTCIRHAINVTRTLEATHYHLLGVPRTILRQLPPILTKLRLEKPFTASGDTLVWKRPGVERGDCPVVPRECGCIIKRMFEFVKTGEA